MNTDSIPAYASLRLELREQVALLTLNRPQRLNAAPPAMFDEIHDALKRLPGLGARALLITGEGRAFCSGADLQASADAPPAAQPVSRGERSYKVLTENYGPAMLALSTLGLPVVTAVNGAAAGIGCSLALAADFTFAARSAYFLQAFVNIGLVPDGGASWMLPRLVGKARATQMMMLGERIGAEQAEQWGLIYRAVDDAELQSQAMAMAQRLAQGPTVALGLMRQGLARALELNYAEALEVEAQHQRSASGSADAREGGEAFLQRRKPVFRGA